MADEYVEALCREIDLRKKYVNNDHIETVYFGGGTPSQLNEKHFETIFKKIFSIFKIVSEPEITVEVNPDDLSDYYIEMLNRLPVNRISVGVQSFNNSELKLLGRRHDAETAFNAVCSLRKAGFDNIGIDLMYGLPDQTLLSWQNTLKQAVTLNVQHISAYHLTYEKGTKMDRDLQKGKIVAADEEISVKMFENLIDTLVESGFEHYEISNFALPGRRSRHNSSYWNSTPYLGLGASAHSYDGRSRQWNISSISEYIKTAGAEPAGFELVDNQTAYNEYIMTGFRTSEGIDINRITAHFGSDFAEYCIAQAQKPLLSGLLSLFNNKLKLTRKGIFVSDGVIAGMMK